MKDYYETKRTKNASYLYYGLVATALAGLMIAWAITSAVRGKGAAIIVTGVLAGLLWGFAAGVSLYTYYSANKSSLKQDGLDSDELL